MSQEGPEEDQKPPAVSPRARLALLHAIGEGKVRPLPVNARRAVE